MANFDTEALRALREVGKISARLLMRGVEGNVFRKQNQTCVQHEIDPGSNDCGDSGGYKQFHQYERASRAKVSHRRLDRQRNDHLG